jgi:hypothetical protein
VSQANDAIQSINRPAEPSWLKLIKMISMKMNCMSLLSHLEEKISSAILKHFLVYGHTTLNVPDLV